MKYCRVEERAGTSADEKWTRYIMNRETKRLVSALSPTTLRVLEISGTAWKDYGFQKYKTLQYPEYDVCETSLDERFDLVIAEQVFEHLLWPYRAGRNIHRMLTNGGWLLVTTPFLFPVHNHPVDCSRWTEMGLRHLLAECGFAFDDIVTDSWGNRQCVESRLENPDRGIAYKPGLHSLDNDERFPVVVWALARRIDDK